jgi:hypothetical protein
MTDFAILLGILGAAFWLCPFLLLRYARKSLRVQTAMLEQLEHLNALAANRTTEPPSGRFSRLGGQ